MTLHASTQEMLVWGKEGETRGGGCPTIPQCITGTQVTSPLLPTGPCLWSGGPPSSALTMDPQEANSSLMLTVIISANQHTEFPY